MENKNLNIDKIDFKDINDLVSGCNAAMVNYALAENKKMVRVVTFFNTDDSNLETIAAAHNFYCKQESKFIISKDIVYKIKSFNHIIRSGIDFWAMLWKKVDGFIPYVDNIHDCTNIK